MTEGRGVIHDLKADARFAEYTRDPFTPFVEREPLTEDVDVAIIGAGMSGVVVGAKLREAGLRRIVLIDKAGGIGGTWYWNRYPGVMCDVESYIYMPMLEEMNYVPTTRYAFGDEIRRHLDAVADEVRTRRRRVVPHRRRDQRVGRGHLALGDPHRPRRRDRARATSSWRWASSTS